MVMGEFFQRLLYWLTTLKVEKDISNICIHHVGKGVLNDKKLDTDGDVWGWYFICSVGGCIETKEYRADEPTGPFQFR